MTDRSQWQKLLAEAWPGVAKLGRAVLGLYDGEDYYAGIRNDPHALHERVLKLIDTMVRGNILGAQLSNLRETVRFP